MRKFKIGDIIAPTEYPKVEDLIINIDDDTDEYIIYRIKGNTNGSTNRITRTYNYNDVEDNGYLVRKATNAEMVLYGKV